MALDHDTKGEAIYSVDAKAGYIAAVGSNGFGKIYKYWVNFKIYFKKKV